MPQMGVSVAEGTIVEWKKRRRRLGRADETIVEISTDKVETEMPSPASGTLTEILVEPGRRSMWVLCSLVLARAEVAGRGSQVAGPRPTEPAVGVRAGGQATGSPRTAYAAADLAGRPADRRRASDRPRRRSTGSGRVGRVTKKDVLAFIGAAVEAPAPPALHSESPYIEDRPRRPATRDPRPRHGAAAIAHAQRRSASTCVRSLETTAHCTTVVEADMSAIEAATRAAVVPAVRGARDDRRAARVPDAERHAGGRRLTVHDEVNLGIAVSLGEDGLIVPVVKNAHELSHEGLAARIKDLAERARNKRLTPDEVSGGTFTITNPGALRGAAGHADHQPAAGRDPRPRGRRQAAGGGGRRIASPSGR